MRSSVRPSTSDGILLARGKGNAEPSFASGFEEFVYYQSPAESWGKHLVMLKAYLDDSGTHGPARVLALTGFVAGARQWVHLDRAWRSALEQEGLEEFHAKEFFTKGFRGWSEDKQWVFLDKMTKPVMRLKLHPIGGAVPMDSYSRLSDDAKLYLTGGVKNLRRDKWVFSGKPSAAYFLVFPFAIARAVSYAEPGIKVHFYLDENDQYEGYAKNWFRELRKLESDFEDSVGDITFADSKRHPGIQLADLLAHLCYQHGQGALSPLQRLCFDRLRLRNRKNLILFDDYSLEKLLSTLPSAVEEHVMASFRDPSEP